MATYKPSKCYCITLFDYILPRFSGSQTGGTQLSIEQLLDYLGILLLRSGVMTMASWGGVEWGHVSWLMPVKTGHCKLHQLHETLCTFCLLYGHGHPPHPSPLVILPLTNYWLLLVIHVKIIQLCIQSEIAHVHLILLHIFIC